MNRRSGRAVMDVRNLKVPDYGDLINAVLGGPSLPGIVSFRVDWAPSADRRRFRNPLQQYDGDMLLTTATCVWRGATAEAAYQSNPDAATQISVYAQVGLMRNGVFFS